MGGKIQSLPGFRDFYPEDCAVRNYVFDHWRSVAHRYNFHEYEGPILENSELYQKKSGEEILQQLFHFEDRGDRSVAMRPELTPTLARMAVARQRDYRKPMRWFGIGQFFRYEKPQKGRGREFYQLNVDILGESSESADAELIAFAIDLMLDFGFGVEDFVIRLSNRDAWIDFMQAESMTADNLQEFLQIIDKMERESPETTDKKLIALGSSRQAVDNFISSSAADKHFSSIIQNLKARNLADHVTIDLGVVRGLAYYTGTVFEVFDRGKAMRAVAGGGRYDNLCGLISNDASSMPACGFAMGDVVITDLIRETKNANSRLLNHLGGVNTTDVQVIIADETVRSEALYTIQQLRGAGFRVNYSMTDNKVGKQFSQAEHAKARVAVIIGSEYPKVGVKDLAERKEEKIDSGEIINLVRAILDKTPEGPLYA
ncbi:MAG: histidine--tRNA ligase [Verrucomicrobiaceae bacterium]|nr:histidine--tRNA ligase [Verrucomicrobiaceae bacterium]